MHRGHSFEVEVTAMLSRLLATRALGLDSDTCQIRTNPRYYSRARNKEITFDVSIEIKRPRVATPYLLWIWECKDYSRPVPVDDIEEFHAKLETIGSDRTKGTVISRNGFQESAAAYAQHHGLGLVKCRLNGEPEFLLDMGSKAGFAGRLALISTDVHPPQGAIVGTTATGRFVYGALMDYVVRQFREWHTGANEQ